jgi:ribosomal protein S18 acetylase RimI-like enzyme
MQWRTEVRASDVEAVRALVAETGVFNAEEVLIAVELIEETLAKGKASGYEFVFADSPDINDSLIGYTCYGHISGTDSSYDLYWIAVSPSHRRDGIGTRLMHESERLARQTGATRMYLDTSGHELYKPTRAFYERLGYEEAAVLKDFFAQGDDKIIYLRKLQAAI